MSYIACTVETVANGQVNTTSTTVVEGTVVVVTCNAGYTLQGSSELTCQADQTWDNPFPTCNGKLMFGVLVCSVSLLFCVIVCDLSLLC